MGRFIRDFGFVASVLVSPVGIYCLLAGIENRGTDAPLYLIVGAALTAAGLLGICSSVREHLIMRDHIRYVQGKWVDVTSRRVPRP